MVRVRCAVRRPWFSPPVLGLSKDATRLRGRSTVEVWPVCTGSPEPAAHPDGYAPVRLAQEPARVLRQAQDGRVLVGLGGIEGWKAEWGSVRFQLTGRCLLSPGERYRKNETGRLGICQPTRHARRRGEGVRRQEVRSWCQAAAFATLSAARLRRLEIGAALSLASFSSASLFFELKATKVSKLRRISLP